MATEVQRRAMRMILITQCLGMLAVNLMQNGVFLSYFSALGIDSAQIAVLFALPALLGMFLNIPLAFVADRWGKLRFSLLGQFVILAGLAVLLLPAVAGAKANYGLLAAGLLTLSLGWTMQGSCWFALLSPIIPAEERGPFFGKLRTTFQLVTVIFTLIVSRILGSNAPLGLFKGVLLVVLAASALRYFSYRNIPEMENTSGDSVSGIRPALKAIGEVLAHGEFMAFHCYLFLVWLVTIAAPMLLGLLEKDVLQFSSGQITAMGSCLLIGSMLGCFCGGGLIRRYGTRLLFMWGHIASALIFLMVPLRGVCAVPLPWIMGLLTFIYGWIGAAVGIAQSSEMLGLIPQRNKSVASAIHVTLASMGAALTPLIISRILDWKLLQPEWTAGGLTLSQYDTIFLFMGIAMLLLIVTLGLVPSVIRKPQILPMNEPRPSL